LFLDEDVPHDARMTDLSPNQAVAILRQGGVIAYPTEAVWGLGCDPHDEAAVTRLLRIKQRPVDKGLIVVAAELDPLRPLLDLSALSPARLAAALASWPGPHTWILPAAASAPPWITGAHHGIAVRISAHPVVAALCRAWGGALVSTSANLGGEPPARQRAELDPNLLAALDGVVGGDTGGLAQPTPIRDAASGEILRA
jgi:L-threonylcarbamoyladenylate synthase